jgi:type II restriction enzyme
MNLKKAKATLDKVIRKGRVHFYKPFQIAEILRRHRTGELDDLNDLDSYKNISKRWRDEVSQRLVGRISTSSARYQDDVFNENACPPEALAALGDYNKANGGQVEAYVYRMFEARVSSVGEILNEVKRATPETFDVSKIVQMFQQRPGLKRSIDKVYEITVYALFSAVVRALRLQVSLSISNLDRQLIKDFGDFLEKIVGLPKGETTITLPARLFRLGSTNAADRGLDMIANFGPAIQVKHLTLDSDAISDICDGITADRIVIVCKESEVTIVDAVVKQLGLADRLQALITFNDLKNWYGVCLGQKYRDNLGKSLLADFVREFSNEFPSLAGLAPFLKDRGYSKISLTGEWTINADKVGE